MALPHAHAEPRAHEAVVAEWVRQRHHPGLLLYRPTATLKDGDGARIALCRQRRLSCNATYGCVQTYMGRLPGWPSSAPQFTWPSGNSSNATPRLHTTIARAVIKPVGLFQEPAVLQ
jgi:hypothetical protein